MIRGKDSVMLFSFKLSVNVQNMHNPICYRHTGDFCLQLMFSLSFSSESIIK